MSLGTMRVFKMVTILIIYGLLLVSSGCASNYQGYKVYEVTPESLKQFDFLHNFNDDKFDFWKESKNLGDATDILVAPEDQWYFEREMTKHGLKFDVVVNDVERLLQQEKVERSLSRLSLSRGGVTFNSYMYYGEHVAYLRRLADDYPDIVTVSTIGQSYEGRDIVLLRLSNGTSTTSPKPGIFIDAGIHAREWIAPPVALYIIQQLVENGDNSAFYQNVDWYIVPNLNPDGYEYTQSNNRLWRKNRRLTEGAACYGTDLNRNFDYQWMVGGASNNSCSETFAGPEPFSEPEARVIRDWFLENGENVKLYLTIHSYGELLLYPWSYAPVLPDNMEEHQSLGERVVAAIEGASVIGSSYVVNTSALGIYIAAGVSSDWAKAAGVDLAYVFELPNGDAPYWFMLPARQIMPVVQETWAGIKVYHEYIEEKYVTNATETPNLPEQDLILRRPFPIG